MNENNIQIEQQSGIEQQSEAQAKRLLAYINQIQIYLDKKDMSVHKLRLSETATN